MSEQNRAIQRRIDEEIWGNGNVAAIEELLAPDFVAHNPGGPPQDRNGFAQLVTVFRTGFPDMSMAVEDQIIEGDRVVQRATMRGTHTGEFQGIPPTGKQVTMGGISINRFAEGKLAEHWSQFDSLGLMQQLGVVPAPEQGG